MDPISEVADISASPADDSAGQRSRINVPPAERVLSGAAGLLLVVAGISRRGAMRWPIVAAGSALFLRGISGRCAFYRAMGIGERRSRSGVPGNRGERIEAAVDIRCPADKLFRFWLSLEELPRVLRHVEAVRQTAPMRSHWKITGPAGKSLEWDAEIINEHENRLIAWQSLPGAAVRNAGSVRFEPTTDELTHVKVAMEFDPPAGSFGVAIAEMLGTSPELDLREDLERFRRFAETELHDPRDTAPHPG